MGAWGEGPFDNDAAGDFVGEASEGSPARAVTRVLKEIAKQPAGEYIEVDLGGWAWAAAELVALSFGRGDVAEQSDAVMDLLGRLKPKEAQRQLALEALPRILDRETSEVAELWHEDEEAGQRFNALVAGLRDRLEAAAAGAIPLPKPKKGDVIALPAGDEKDGFIAVHVISMREVGVYEGTFAADAEIEDAVTSANAKRIGASVGGLFRAGRVVTNVRTPKTLRGKKLYATPSGPLSEDYVLTNTSFSVWDPIEYQEALKYDHMHDHDPDEVRRVGLGEDVAGRLRTIEERVADWKKLYHRVLAGRREESGPGPFDDHGQLSIYVAELEAAGMPARIAAEYGRAIRAAESGGRPWRRGTDDIMYGERHAYAFVGIVALWRGAWPEGAWPESLADRYPEKPDEEQMELATKAARIRVTQILTPDCALHMLWDGIETEGPTIREIVQSLERALKG